MRVVLILLIAACLVTAFIDAPGTFDVFACILWADHAAATGPLTGYGLLHVNYPPLSVFLMWLSLRLGHAAGMSDLLSYKAAIAVFSLAALGMALRRGRREEALILLLIVSPFGLALGYYDPVYLPFFLLAFDEALRGRWGSAGAALAVAGLIKWQPIILAPLFLLAGYGAAQSARRFALVLLPTIMVVAAVLALFGPGAVFQALSAAERDNYFSGQGVNVAWIMSFVFEALHIDGLQFQPNGAIAILQPTSAPLIAHAMNVLRILFYLWFILSLVIYAAGRKTREAFLAAALCTTMVQFTWNTGVHENHLFVPMIVGFVAWRERVLDGFVFAAIAAVAILNVLLFYGFDDGFNYTNLFGFDSTLFLALAELLLFFLVFGLQMRLSFGASGRPLHAAQAREV